MTLADIDEKNQQSDSYPYRDLTHCSCVDRDNNDTKYIIVVHQAQNGILLLFLFLRLQMDWYQERKIWK
jgi:hypothetical protein